MKQLDLFAVAEPLQNKVRYYTDLNIHEKINVKGNSLQFARTYIRQARYRRFPIRRDDHPECLRWERLQMHYRLNPKSIETIVWREKEQNLLGLKSE